MPRSSDWRSEQTAEKLLQLDRSEIAIEFLRRNPAYREDYRRVYESITASSLPHDPAIAELASRWGLTFRSSTGCPCLELSSHLETRTFTFHYHHCAGAAVIQSRKENFHRWRVGWCKCYDGRRSAPTAHRS